MSAPAWFDKNTYFQNKLAQLQAAEPANAWTADKLVDAFKAAGYDTTDDGMYKHFVEYGNAENVSPSGYFDVDAYMQSKLAQMQATDPNYTMADLEAAFKANELSAWDHYLQFGAAEGIDPSSLFDTSAYMEAKLAQMQATNPNYTMAQLEEAFVDAGLTPVAHYLAYGKNENLSYTPGQYPVAPNIPGEGGGDNPGETYYLTAQQDGLTGTSGDDSFIATEFDGVNTLQSGDRVDGGEGNDSLYADLTAGSSFGQILNTVTPIVSNVEKVVFNSRQSTDDFTGTQSVANVDAERISGMKELWSSDSRADLTVEDVRSDSNSMTIGFQNADVDTDFNVYFDNQYLKADAAQTTGTLNLQLIDIRGSVDNDQPLLNNTYDTVRFDYTVNGKTETVRLEFGVVNGADATYQDLADAINAALKAAGYNNITASVSESTFTLNDPKGEGAATGNYVTLTATDGTVTAPASGNGWIASEGVPAGSDLSTDMVSSADTTCPLITTDIALDNVGRVEWNDVTTCIPDNQQFGDYAGDMVVGGMGNGDYVGIQDFDVTVDGGSWLSSLSSTNFALRNVTVKNGDLNGDGKIGTQPDQTFNGKDAADKGNLFIGDGMRLTDVSDAADNLMFAGRDGILADAEYAHLDSNGVYHSDSGLLDVKNFDASAMEGKANISAAITDVSSDKYLSNTDTVDGLGNQFAPGGDFSYTFGSNDDTLNMNIDGNVAADQDFKLNIDMGNGDNTVQVEFQTDNNLANWEYNQHQLKNVNITTGSGNDIINAYGTGHVNISAGAGDDIVYSDNSGDKAVFVFNTVGNTGSVYVDALGAIAPVQNDFLSKDQTIRGAVGVANTNVNITLSVTFKGVTGEVSFTVAADENGNVPSMTDQQINQYLMNAVNNDPELSALLSAQEGAGHSLIFASKVDGTVAEGDLSFGFSATTGTGNAVTDVTGTFVTNLGGYLTGNHGFATDGSTGGANAPLSGADSSAHADNVINLGDGNDVAVLGTGANSNDTIVLSNGHNGNNLIVNFDVSGATAAGRDFLRVSAALGGSVDAVTNGLTGFVNGTATAPSQNVIFYQNLTGNDHIDNAGELQTVLNGAKGSNPLNSNSLFMVYDANGAATFTMYLVKFGADGTATVSDMSSVTFADFIGAAGQSAKDFVDAAVKYGTEMFNGVAENNQANTDIIAGTNGQINDGSSTTAKTYTFTDFTVTAGDNTPLTSITAGSGDDTFNATGDISKISLNGGDGEDTLNISGATEKLDLTAISHIEKVSITTTDAKQMVSFTADADVTDVSMTNGALTLDASAAAGLKTVALAADNGAVDTITVAAPAAAGTFAATADSTGWTISGFDAADKDVLNVNGFSATGFAKVAASAVDFSSANVVVVTDKATLTDTDFASAQNVAANTDYIVVAGQGADATVYLVNAGNDTKIDAGEVKELGTLQGVTGDDLTGANFGGAGA